MADHMGIGVSIFLIAVGAILTWAVTATTSGINIHTVGVILMIVGLAGLILSLLFWSSWGGYGFTTRRRVVSGYGAAPAPPVDGPVEREIVDRY